MLACYCMKTLCGFHLEMKAKQSKDSLPVYALAKGNADTYFERESAIMIQGLKLRLDVQQAEPEKCGGAVT